MPVSPLPACDAIVLDSVSVSIGGTSILHGILGEFRGTRACALGPSHGKTTLLRMITGYRFPTTGGITVLGERLGYTNLDDLRRRVRLAPDPNIEHLAED